MAKLSSWWMGGAFGGCLGAGTLFAPYQPDGTQEYEQPARPANAPNPASKVKACTNRFTYHSVFIQQVMVLRPALAPRVQTCIVSRGAYCKGRRLPSCFSRKSPRDEAAERGALREWIRRR